MKTLTAPRMERCIGCHSCSLACARLVHKCLSWDMSGIRIISSGGLSTGFEAKTCLACDPSPCAEACPTGAYSQRKGGGVIVKKKLCIRCGECDKACPVDAIYLDPAGEPFVCIHCGRCVPFCPHDCLEQSEEDGIHHRGTEATEKGISKNDINLPSEAVRELVSPPLAGGDKGEGETRKLRI